jgi:CRISPR type I-E-associated protein CasA/Cse1
VPDTPSYPLTTSPWIEVYDTDTCTARKVGITEALTRSHRLILPTAGSASIPLLRLLAAVYDAACGPADNAQWDVAWRVPALDARRITAYLDTWGERFDLFHPTRPAFQCGALTTWNRDASALNPASLGGEAEIWFDGALSLAASSGQYPAWQPGQAAVHLLWLLAYDVAGIKGAAPGDPAGKGNKVYGSHTGPVAAVTHLHINGPTLKDTLLLSLPPQPRAKSDAPVWEREEAPAEMRVRDPLGRLDRLTWPARRIRLRATPQGLVDGLALHEGDRLSGNLYGQAHRLDPMSLWYTTKKGRPFPLSVTRDHWAQPWTAALALADDRQGRSAVVRHVVAAAERGVLGDLPLSVTTGEIIHTNDHRSTIADDPVTTVHLGTGRTLADPETRIDQARRARLAGVVISNLRQTVREVVGSTSGRYLPRLVLTNLNAEWEESIRKEACDDIQVAHELWTQAVYAEADQLLDQLPLSQAQKYQIQVAYRQRPAPAKTSTTTAPTRPTDEAAPAAGRRAGRPAQRYEWRGQRYTLAELAARTECQVSAPTIRNRLKSGMTLEEAVTLPPQKGSRTQGPDGAAAAPKRGRRATEYEWRGRHCTLAQIAQLPECRVSYPSLLNRLAQGMTLEEAVTTPPRSDPRKTSGTDTD